MEGDGEKAVAGGLHTDGCVTKSCDGLELVVSGHPCPVVQVDDVQGRGIVAVAVTGVEEGEGGLVGVVGEEEVPGGGGAAPSAADSAAAEEGFWWEADEDLPDEDLLRETTAQVRRPGLRHGSRPEAREWWWSMDPSPARGDVVGDFDLWM